MRRGIGAQMLAARLSAELTQHEVARRMGTKRTSVSRAEAGRTRASIDFLERFARALGRPMSVTFGGPTIPSETERWQRASLVFRHLFEDARGIYPTDARYVGLKDDDQFDATQAYRFTVNLTARSGQGPKPWKERNPKDLRWAAAAIASIWYDEIDWARLRDGIASDPRVWRADINARMKARRVAAARGP
jgi:transcriptional regulator with XRE-family HTH domain